jgi:hypothetical protein
MCSINCLLRRIGHPIDFLKLWRCASATVSVLEAPHAIYLNVNYCMLRWAIFLDITNLSLVASSASIETIFLLPFERDRQFVGREDILSQLEKHFQGRFRVSLYGLGGIGYASSANNTLMRPN